MADAVVFRNLHDTIKNAARSEQGLTLSAKDVHALSAFIDELIQTDVEAFLRATQDAAVDDADERDFVNAASLRFRVDDDPADSVYDDL
jgi:hypothetical protein